LMSLTQRVFDLTKQLKKNNILNVLVNSFLPVLNYFQIKQEVRVEFTSKSLGVSEIAYCQSNVTNVCST